ncbi:hypothetical protein MF672_005455 [Actinomadura sp. ATCC 31491]|uniref:Uncharacterized protein n=1 Tax=Actinomadura luzonensis TaxID=2805427 RepID=A0ABT0FM36_9ACTN|nr:hypothetical protein [Actinomadura luzonensis]MCK2213243.1 hypothetical protein [Actinomadura luzonensis]
MQNTVEHRYGRDGMRLVTASFRTHHFVPHAHSEYAVAAIERLPGGSNADLCRRTPRGKVNPYSPGSQLADGLVPAVDLDPDLLLSGQAQQIGTDEHILYKPR